MITHTLNLLFPAIIIGIGATIIMDLWSILMKFIFNIPSLNYAMMGRFLGHLTHGQYFHTNIQQSSSTKYEVALGWLAHYLIGIIFAIFLIYILGNNWLMQPTFLPCLIFGIITVVFPFFVLQPALGAGIAAAKTPIPNTMRLRSLMAHISFGVGLYIIALFLTHIMY